MNANTKVYYQEVEMRAVMDWYVKSFKLPENSELLQWDANYDSHTGKVWFRLTVELPDENGKVLVMDFDRTIKELPKR